MSETERVTLVGNLTADPELRYTPSGLEVANLRIAVTPRTRQEDGSWRVLIDDPWGGSIS